MSARDIETRARELQELKRLREELDAEIAASEDEIKAELTARGTDELTAGAFRIRWKPITASRLDQKAFKAELPEIYSRYCVEAVQRRFTLA